MEDKKPIYADNDDGHTLSVVFPNFNHSKYLPEALDAFLSQSRPPDEIIIIDDASTDNSVDVIRAYMEKDARIKLICNKKNMGVEHNINRLIEMATGEYIFLSAADDQVLPGFFEKSLEMLARYPEAGLCSGIVRLIGENSEDRGIRDLPVVSREARYFTPEEVKEILCKYGRWIQISALIMKRECLLKEGAQREEMGSFADQFLTLVIALKYGACFIPEPLGCWRQLPSGNANQLGRDWKALGSRGEAIVGVMQKEYKDLFPNEFISKFSSHWRYMVGSTVSESIRVDGGLVAGEAVNTVCSKRSVVGCMFKPILRILLLCMALLVRIYSVLRYGTFLWWIRGRLSLVLTQKKLIFWEDERT
tara:strand:- start:1343 stop:2431 length:1089 start_codon:yes stop_codon:yes gene_type:complete